MDQATAKPVSSRIEEIDQGVAHQYRWTHPGGQLIRYVVAGILILWLCGLARFWFPMVLQLLRSSFQLTSKFELRQLLRVCLGEGIGVCIVAGFGIIVLRELILTLIATEPESVTLGDDGFRYDSGNSPLMSWGNPFIYYDPGQTYRHPDDTKYYRRRRPRKQVTLTRSELPSVVLDDVGPRKRLSFQQGTEQIEIGRFLKDPDREWLAAVIKRWQAG